MSAVSEFIEKMIIERARAGFSGTDLEPYPNLELYYRQGKLRGGFGWKEVVGQGVPYLTLGHFWTSYRTALLPLFAAAGRLGKGFDLEVHATEDTVSLYTGRLGFVPIGDLYGSSEHRIIVTGQPLRLQRMWRYHSPLPG